MSPTIINFPAQLRHPATAEGLWDAAPTKPANYYRPKGMGPRQHNKIFHHILDGEGIERQAYLAAMDRVAKARKEVEAGLAEQHRIIFAVMWRSYPDLARRVVATMKRGRS